MPNRPMRPCRWPGCSELVRVGYCEVHAPMVQTKRKRSSAIYGHQWRLQSKQFLAEHPWCAECERANKHEPAVLVDHIVPHKGNLSLFWDRNNWQGLCWACHSSKTAREDGGFGHAAATPGQKSFKLP